MFTDIVSLISTSKSKCITMVRLVPVKLRPDQYCSQIRDTNRKGKNVNITRLQERMEYVKVKKEKGEGMSNYGAQINCETMCGPDLSIENNNLSIESHPSQSAALSATNDPVDYDEVGVVRDRDDQNHSRYNSFVISLEESQAKCVQYEIESDSSSDRGARDESDYDDRSSRLKRVEVRLRRVDVDNPVDRDDRGARDEGLGSRVEVGVSIEKTLRNKPFTCPMCERGFTALSSVQDHIDTCNSR